MQELLNYLKEHQLVSLLVSAVIVFAVVLIILKVSRKLFRKLREKQSRLDLHFSEKVFRFLVIFISVMWLVMSNDLTKSFGASLFQSTAVIAAIAGFAAQSVLSDFICGIILSSNKPFVVGDRIELENGVGGIVKDMTLRHIVLMGLDTQVWVIPNSKVNAQYVRNMSWHTDIRSVEFRFSVAYTADPEFAAGVIRGAIAGSPCAVPGKPGKKEGESDYAPVYFLGFKDSSLDMATTVYYKPTTPTEVLKNDINTRVKKALEENGIEIPYNYLNVNLRETARQA